MKIDIHVHVTPPDIIRDWEKIARKEPYFKLLSESPVNQFADAEKTIQDMEADGFDKAVIFGFGFQDMGLCRYVNDYVMDKARAYPDRLIGFASVLPQHKEVERELLRCQAGGLRGVGELFPQGQQFDLASAQVMAPFARTLEALGWPVIFHLNEPVGHPYAGKTKTRLEEAEAFARHFPDLVTILAHWGGGLFFYELMAEVSKTLANVYYDTAASVFLYGHKVYNVVKSLDLTRKILFGSDYPLLPPRRYMADMEKSDLTQEEIAAILGGNAQRLLKLA